MSVRLDGRHAKHSPLLREPGRIGVAGVRKHKVITASRITEYYDYLVDITSEVSIRELYESVGHFDAVVNTVGVCEYAPFTEMTEAQWLATVMSKMLGQVNLVRIGQEHIADKGSLPLITGILYVKPIPLEEAWDVCEDMMPGFQPVQAP